MRGSDGRAGELFAYVDLERRVPADHPLRVIRAVVNAAPGELSGALGQLYARLGRPSIPPEKLLRALLLQAFYSIRSERQLMERLEFDPLFRWFVGLGIEDPVWDASTFSKNRDRLLAGEVAARFLATVLAQPEVKRLLSDDHFSVDGTLMGRTLERESRRHAALRGNGTPSPMAGMRYRSAKDRGWFDGCATVYICLCAWIFLSTRSPVGLAFRASRRVSPSGPGFPGWVSPMSDIESSTSLQILNKGGKKLDAGTYIGCRHGQKPNKAGSLSIAFDLLFPCRAEGR